MMSRSDYLKYGDAELNGFVQQEQTLDYLQSLGFGRGELYQARMAIESDPSERFTFESVGVRYCDFCFGQIMGGEYEELKDGRDRCSRCSRSVLQTHEQFVDEYQQVLRNMEMAFAITIPAPKVVKMVNARHIARNTGEIFVKTDHIDPRVLGYAQRTRDGTELYIENGSPRMPAVLTMAHELTHVWQFKNWNEKRIEKAYGAQNRLAIYEGMAAWAMIQYLLFTKDLEYANRQIQYLLARNDEYGDGFKVFIERYPLSFNGEVDDDTPFHHEMPF
jgi:hypothetical protein